jgi:hypothetical protein
MLLYYPGMQTDSVLAHARLFFEDYVPPSTAHVDDALAADIQTEDEPLRDYYCYVLLDFATSDDAEGWRGM